MVLVKNRQMEKFCLKLLLNHQIVIQTLSNLELHSLLHHILLLSHWTLHHLHHLSPRSLTSQQHTLQSNKHHPQHHVSNHRHALHKMESLENRWRREDSKSCRVVQKVYGILFRNRFSSSPCNDPWGFKRTTRLLQNIDLPQSFSISSHQGIDCHLCQGILCTISHLQSPKTYNICGLLVFLLLLHLRINLNKVNSVKRLQLSKWIFMGRLPPLAERSKSIRQFWMVCLVLICPVFRIANGENMRHGQYLPKVPSSNALVLNLKHNYEHHLLVFHRQSSSCHPKTTIEKIASLKPHQP